jgi:hypothetical protein
MRYLSAVFLILAAVAPGAAAEELENGFYVANFSGEGTRAQRHDGGEVVLGKWLGRALGDASLRSVSNNNTQFVLQLSGAGPFPKVAADARLAVVIEGICLIPSNRSAGAREGTADLSYTINDRESVQTVARYLGVDLEERKHPGHRFEVRWTPDKKSYAVGEPITLTMAIHNTGDAAFTFFVGGQQRGPRDNQFRFLAYAGHGGGKAVPDTGDPLNFGGKGTYHTLKPGESLIKSVSIDRWFQFTEPDAYQVTGLFEMRVYGSRKREFDEVIWDDLTAGDCLVRIVEKAVKKD